MTSRSRIAVAALVLLAVLGTVVLLAFAGNACAGDLPGEPCPDAGTNRAVVVSLAAMTAGVAVTPFALLAEFAVRRRIIYRGAWGRAIRRGVLVGAVVAAVAGLRLGGALSVPVALFVISLAAATEWIALRRFDLP
ncbi:MAG: hypothetical protein H0W81_03385 [Chloroflexi bacterium]|nr:hypothetical protein [Chloroflexota bacterium]